ncbi:hypothetical protein H9P43_006149 [Blastocladiella emersonii ATCC 22665]|nr:hypothetical protein H9P43_006149 [Blastocladiella emersonii ATCC 22665]
MNPSSTMMTPPLHPGEPATNTDGPLSPLPQAALSGISGAAVSAPIALPPSPTGRTLVVCDFDWTLIDCDSDELCLHHFGGPGAVQRLAAAYAQGGVWCELVAQELANLFEQHDINDLEALRSALRAAPMHAKTVQLIRTLYEQGCEVVILSDANTFFIETILEAYDLRHCIAAILTNPATFAKTASHRDILVVDPLQGPHDPHACLRACPSNLCKSVMLARYTARASPPVDRVFYCGDGTNDFCPMASGMVHCAFVRAGRRLHATLAASSADEVKEGKEGRYMAQRLLPCPAVLWDDGEELHAKLLAELGGM